MKRWIGFATAALLLTLILGSAYVLSGCGEESNSTEVEKTVSEKGDPESSQAKSAVHPKGLTAEEVKALLSEAVTEEEVQEIINQAPQSVLEELERESSLETVPAEPAWTHPVAGLAMDKYGLLPDEILAVQRVVMLSKGVPIDSADVVVTEDRWYYQSLIDGTFSLDPPSLLLTTEIDIYGIGIENYGGQCWWSEWVVTFYLPVCFFEIAPGRFDGIIDAWAPNPPCGQCNGGICAAYRCGSAWDGAGYNNWRNYNDCGGKWSRKVGKMVQKRWLFTWRNCGRADWQIASSVRARIRY
ncbi:MAG: hypothetical protein Q8P56_06595 [Candidatus Uhrbacteria bacterium]|nr:hypothetical protein [Candidatus Uhrbacteria bacterium]